MNNVKKRTSEPKYLIITAHHDYRTPRRSSVHFIADELSKLGAVRFFSMRYSFLSKKKGDIRVDFDKESNKIALVNGVESFLWKTWVHPFNMRRKWLQPLENLLFRFYERKPCTTLINWMSDADFIVFESGISVMYFEFAKKINPSAKHIYLASDDLETICVSNYIISKFSKISGNLDAVCLVSRAMAENIPDKRNLYYVPHGLNEDLNEIGDPSPYEENINAVSVGSMLFDPNFFEIASRAFPEITFHVIGSGQISSPSCAKNVRYYGHMAYDETIRYIKHANIGIAPYISDNVPVYLADSSMKMLQYDFFAIPTVCPNNVTGSYASRFGYSPGNAGSIIEAIRLALKAPHQRSRNILSWSQVTKRLINPSAYDDARLETNFN